jgi:hypothetical protein
VLYLDDAAELEQSGSSDRERETGAATWSAMPKIAAAMQEKKSNLSQILRELS